MERIPRPISDGKECRQCRFFEVITNLQQPGQQITLCRRNAPRAHAQVVGMSPPPTDAKGVPIGPAQPQWTQYTLWPVVSTTDWCGDFAKRPQDMN